MKDVYIGLQGWMTRLGLRGKALIVFAMIDGLTHGRFGCWMYDYGMVEAFTGCSQYEIAEILDWLKTNHFIEEHILPTGRATFYSIIEEENYCYD